MVNLQAPKQSRDWIYKIIFKDMCQIYVLETNELYGKGKNRQLIS